MAKTRVKRQAPVIATTAEFRLSQVIDHSERQIQYLQADYDRARRSFADELADGDGPTWISSSSEHEWRRLRTELQAARAMLKSLLYVRDGAK
jgi:hypothetical protein